MPRYLATASVRAFAGRHRSPRGGITPLALAAATLFVCVGVAASGLFAAWRAMPDLDAVRRIGTMDRATRVFDRHGRLAFTIFREQRIEVPLSAMSPDLVRAIVAVEDQRFYRHGGFDTIRIVSAALGNLRKGRAAQGGSTITQQLARQSFLTSEKTMSRKLQELVLACRIERLYSKQQILEFYLNKVYFGDGLYGVEAASRGYFGKSASALSLPEAALLAGLVKSPSAYAPTVNLGRAVGRRNVVLQVMVDSGAIDRARWKAARATGVVLRDTLRHDDSHGRYFKEQVRRALVDRFGWQRVYQGGLGVYTTLDMPMQIAADQAVAESLQAIDRRRRAAGVRPAAGDAEPLQAALVALDPASGQVRAMVGGRDFAESSFNRATQARRQPGSAFKPFVYAAALESGYTPGTILDRLNDPISTIEGAWMPEDEHVTAASMTMRAALRTSSNRAAVRLLQSIGIPRTVQYARQLGVGDLPEVPSLALGSGEVALQSLTSAYAAFANGGMLHEPVLVTRVDDQDGTLLYEVQGEPTRAVTPVTAFLMSTMLADVVDAGTAARARRLGFTLPAAGKTGTTNDFNDAWFVGFTPRLVAGVWVGFDQPQTIMPNGFAAEVAVPLWTAFMKAATRGDPPDWFAPPAGVTTARICRLSGKLAGPGCDDVDVLGAHGTSEHRSMAYTEYFASGTEPTVPCDLHGGRGVLDRLAGLFGAGPTARVVRADDLADPPASRPVEVPASARATSATAGPPEPAKKSRGFWARLFGRSARDRERED